MDSPFLFLTVAEALERDDARGVGFHRRLLGTERGRAADVEGAHGELGSGLADRLSGDDADSAKPALGHADLHDLAGGDLAAGAQRADAAQTSRIALVAPVLIGPQAAAPGAR